MAYTPTTAELRDAFRRGRLWWLGWTFQKAQALANQVRAERARIEQEQGKPSPVQPALFERTA